MEKIIFYNGDIITMENEEDVVEAVLVENEIIKKIGNLKEIEENLNGDVKKINLEGRTLMPSFIDAHSHITAYAKTFSYANLQECKSINDILKILETYKQENNIEENKWIIGVGYDNNFLEEKRHPRIEELDNLNYNNPILVTHVSGHMGVFNSKALEELGINVENTKFGYLEENDFIKQTAKIGGIGKEEEIENIKKAQEKYASYGITTVQDGLTKKEDFNLLKELKNNLFLDIVCYIDLSENRDVIEENENYVKKYVNNLKIGGYKIILDGSPQAKTAYLSKPYEGEKEYRGNPSKEDSEVENYIKISNENNMQLLAHCNGDGSAEQFINAIEKGNENIKNNYLIKENRPVMIHAQIIRKEQILKCKELEIIPSFFVAHVYYWGDVHIENLGKRAYRISPAKEAVDNNMVFTFHQDTPVIEPNVLETIWVAVNRKTKNGVILGEDEKIDVYEALKAVTIYSAYQYFEEDLKGSIKEGKLADLVILSENPLKVNKEEIRNIKICSTWKNGKEIYSNQNL